MSQITHEDIAKLGELAMLELTDQEKQNLANSINNILAYVGMVTEADLSNLQSSHKFTDIARADKLVQVVGSHDVVMANARQVSPDGFLEVSKVINK